MHGMAAYAQIEPDSEIRCDVHPDGEVEIYVGGFQGHGFFEGVTLAVDGPTMERMITALTEGVAELRDQGSL